MASLWEIGGKLIENDAGTALLDCDDCPCDGRVCGDIPDTIIWTFVSMPCIALSGTWAQLNRSGSEWSGTMANGPCAGMTVIARRCRGTESSPDGPDTNDCFVCLDVYNGSSLCMSFKSNNSSPNPFTTMRLTATTDWNPTNCPCCGTGGGSGASIGDLSI